MKIPFSPSSFSFSSSGIRSGRQAEPFSILHPPSSQRKRENAVALVVTLILLAVTLVMAVAFLAVSRRERSSVTTESDTTAAKLAAAAALARAEAQIVSQILTTTNPYISSLLVSTNYINSLGFTPNSPNPTNVNYNNYIPSGGTPGGPLNLADWDQNIANLFYLPRPPVFYSNDFRFYLDLNRNGEFDTNGVVLNQNNLGETNGTFSLQVGDPEWIGILEHPDAPHGPNNPFIARYCFIAVPADSLDLNQIHNQALDVLNTGTGVNPPTSRDDGYSRDQGVGSWEINLAALLTDLNTNRWDPPTFWNTLGEPYLYPEGPIGKSIAFDDARALVAWRYANYYPFLADGDIIFSNPVPIITNGVDSYSIGLQTTLNTNFYTYNNLNISRTTPWLGSPNTNNYFGSPSDLFDPNKTSVQFTNDLLAAGTNISTYDRYTFYRMLGQLGTDTSPESGQININYQNALVTYNAFGVPTNIAVIPNAETNVLSWAPRDFFNAAADKLLRAYTAEWFEENPSNYLETYYGIVPQGYLDLTGRGVTNLQYSGQLNQIPSFSITNIPVFVNGQYVYSSAVNRLLQLAANIYDASTNSFFPDVFRPIFEHDISNNVYIVGYTNLYSTANGDNTVSGTTDPQLGLPADLTNWVSFVAANTPVCTNIYGVPWIIGAKKGFPNFNRLDFQSDFTIQRLLQFVRDTNTLQMTGTNQMYLMNFSNMLGVACWNSYYSNYNDFVTISLNDTVSSSLTNNLGLVIPNVFPTNVTFATIAPWPGYNNGSGNSSYIMPLGQDSDIVPTPLNPSLTSSNNWYTYLYGSGPNLDGYTANTFIPESQNPENYLDVGLAQLPQFVLSVTNRLQIFMLDDSVPVHVIDYVNFAFATTTNLNNIFNDPPSSGLFSTNNFNGIPFGINEQILYNEGNKLPTYDADMPLPQYTNNPDFQAFIKGAALPNGSDPPAMQAPANPVRMFCMNWSWQANDPLVHYLASDLYDPWDDKATNAPNLVPFTTSPLIGTGVNSRYAPWGTLGNLASPINGITFADSNPNNLSYKDPAVGLSDNWDFPTNKYPGVGWIGRVHRGTPWQTVYLKSSNIWSLVENIPNGPQGNLAGQSTWELWSGDLNAYDAFNSAPFQDQLLFDLFTAAPNDDATRGRLSVNIGASDPANPLAGLASWSAVLSGALALSNNLAHQQVLFVPHYQNPTPAQIAGSEVLGYTNWTLQPLGTPQPGLNPANSPLWQIVTGINNARTNIGNFDGLTNVFEHVGYVLNAPQLSVASPFLNAQNDQYQQRNGISDEMYEWLPQQAMSLLTVSGTPQSPPRYVVYCYGQTLKPAPNGLVTSGTYFGLCTNYQVVSESASRVIIRVVNAPTPANPSATPHVVIEQYNPLPPD